MMTSPISLSAIERLVEEHPRQRSVLPSDYEGKLVVIGKPEDVLSFHNGKGNRSLEIAAYFHPITTLPDTNIFPFPVLRSWGPSMDGIPLLYCGKPIKELFMALLPYRNTGALLYWENEVLSRSTRHDKELFATQGGKVEWLYNRLEDEESKRIFLSILKASVTDEADFYSVSGYPEYLHPVVQPEKDDYVLDVGAYDGDSAAVFSPLVGSKGRVVSVEASAQVFEALCLNCTKEKLKNVIPVFGAASDKEEILRFSSNRKYPNSHQIARDGNASVSGLSIDNLVQRLNLEKVDLIKLDVEGAEDAALRGAKETIRRFRPKIALSIYHKWNDYWNLSKLLDDIMPGYKFYLGHHNFYATETDLYAIFPKSEKSRKINSIQKKVCGFFQKFTPHEDESKERSNLSEIPEMLTKELQQIPQYYALSYAQIGEDIILHKFLHSIENGHYIDVGCSDPTIHSVTQFFYDRGWSGLNIDPRPEVMDRYGIKRPRDINRCIGISNQEGELPFWVAHGLSTFNEDTVNRLGKEKFSLTTSKLTTLDNILKQDWTAEDIHFLKIDVETYEKNVLESVNLSIYRPWVISVESWFPLTHIPTFQEWEAILTEHSYAYLTEYKANRFYGAREKLETLTTNFLSMPLVPFMTWPHKEILMRVLNAMTQK